MMVQTGFSLGTKQLAHHSYARQIGQGSFHVCVEVIGVRIGHVAFIVHVVLL